MLRVNSMLSCLTDQLIVTVCNEITLITFNPLWLWHFPKGLEKVCHEHISPVSLSFLYISSLI